MTSRQSPHKKQAQPISTEIPGFGSSQPTDQTKEAVRKDKQSSLNEASSQSQTNSKCVPCRRRTPDLGRERSLILPDSDCLPVSFYLFCSTTLLGLSYGGCLFVSCKHVALVQVPWLYCARAGKALVLVDQNGCTRSTLQPPGIAGTRMTVSRLVGNSTLFSRCCFMLFQDTP